MPIWIDDRAGSAQLVKYPPLDKLAELTRLDSADFCLPGNGPDGGILVGGEVKSYEDFLASALNGRLQATQLPGLVRDHEVRWLVLYGGIRCGPDGEIELRRKPKSKSTKIAIRPKLSKLWFPYTFGSGGRPLPWKFYLHRLFEVAAAGVEIWHEPDVKGVARWIGFLHGFWSRPWDEHNGMRTIDRSHTPPLMQQLDRGTRVRLEVAHALPHLGFERALAAARHFPSPYAMFTASAEQWRQVPGIGKVIAEEIVAFIHGAGGRGRGR